MVEAIVAQRRRHPRWGAQKLLAVAAPAGADGAWPARSTVCALLKQRGLVCAVDGVAPRRRRHPPLTPITSAQRSVDDRLQRRIPHQRLCLLLSLHAARWLSVATRCGAMRCSPQDEATVRDRFCTRASPTYGLPERIRSDNGGPFAAPGSDAACRASRSGGSALGIDARADRARPSGAKRIA